MTTMTIRNDECGTILPYLNYMPPPPTTHKCILFYFYGFGESKSIYTYFTVYTGELLLLSGTGAGTRQSTGGGYYHITAHTSSRVHPEKSEDIS